MRSEQRLEQIFPILRLAYFGLLSVLITAGNAKADEWWDLAQITCVPEIGYFAVRTFGQYNSLEGLYQSDGELDLAKVSELENRFGIYLPERLAKKPFECSVPVGRDGVLFSARVTVNYTPPQPRGQCMGNGWAEINVTVNGVDLGTTNMTVCIDGWPRRLVEAKDDGVGVHIQSCESVLDGTAELRDGRDQDHQDEPVPTTCRWWNLPRK
jgi:hypothetical protein